MNHQVLYRKYRPKSFDEVIGQEHVVGVLTSALAQGKVAHGYLFAGPRGVGKTTVARLIAKAMNCEGKTRPCNDCNFCNEFNEGRSMNLIEIDAASNRGIDEVRELRENVRITPGSGNYKIYVIDEAHQLTKDAFNALLKTLEEPPQHAVFILATTELDKLPQTIVSRLQHFDFRRPSFAEIAARLIGIAGKEGISLEKDAAETVARLGEGSMRDAESILGRVVAVERGNITLKTLEEFLGLPRRELVRAVVAAVSEKNPRAVVASLHDVVGQGHDLGYFTKALLENFRAALALKADPTLREFLVDSFPKEDLDFLEAKTASLSHDELNRAVRLLLVSVGEHKRSPIPELPLELALLEVILEN
ncbi:MAG: DNA polymerase III subunit gamma/tau [bacterium]|nr:DNA polymerase III subunit gamma/tau [bacterium]